MRDHEQPGLAAQTASRIGGEAQLLELDLGSLHEAIRRTQAFLLQAQDREGYWVGELEADVTVTAGYIPLMYFLTGNVHPERQRKAVDYVRGRQQGDGGWGAYHGGPGNLSVTTQAYFALKLAGVSAEEPFMQRAREFVLSKGGVSRANVFTKIWLALFGQFPWQGTPSLPPEIILLPDWFYLNIYEFASWSRATIVALMAVLTKKPICRIPESARVSELYVEAETERNWSVGKIDRLLSWRTLFLLLDRLFKWWEKLPVQPGRELALRRTEKWILDHQEADGSWGGIMLPWAYSLIALRCLGYPADHPAIAKGIEGLEGFVLEDATSFRLQPATSPVWDTAWTIIALRESGLPADHPALANGARWLLKEEIRIGGDWRVKNPRTEPGCWAFEFENDLYPDIDDTAVVPRALLRVRLPNREEGMKADAVERGLRWVLSMQSSDGGWAAFDLDNNKEILAHIPFADFMTPLDPTSPDVTAHAIELMGELGRESLQLKKAIQYVQSNQEADGAWYGRWGVNYLYGTGLVLAGLKAAGEDMRSRYVRKAVSWLEDQQNDDGGWGETCLTYEGPTDRGRGPSTASQTAWALLGLMSADEANSAAVRKGISYLVTTQADDGCWHEDAYTGTGFPRAFYLRYDLYRAYFPLLALGLYRAFLGGGGK